MTGFVWHSKKGGKAADFIYNDGQLTDNSFACIWLSKRSLWVESDHFHLCGYFYLYIDSSWKCLSLVYSHGDLTLKENGVVFLLRICIDDCVTSRRKKSKSFSPRWFFLASLLATQSTVVFIRSHVLVEITHAKPLKLMTKPSLFLIWSTFEYEKQ